MITQERLQELLHYDPETGIFRWRVKRKKMNPGDVAGHTIGRGYVKISVHDKQYFAHRLAFLYMTGEFPPGVMDHINCVKNDNRWANLRSATHKINAENIRVATSRNKVGILGVASPRNGRTQYKSSIQHNGARFHLGYFETPELAHSAYISAKRKLHKGGTL